MRYPYTCVASGSGSKMSKGRGGAALRLNDFTLIYSPFAAGVCIALTPTLGQNQRAADRRANYRAFRVLRGKKFITLISIKLYSSYCREVWGSSIKQQFLQGSGQDERGVESVLQKRDCQKSDGTKVSSESTHNSNSNSSSSTSQDQELSPKKNTTTTTTNRRRNCSRKRSGGGILYKMEDERINRASRR